MKLVGDAEAYHTRRLAIFMTGVPGARLLGRGEAGPSCYIGAGAVILPKVRLGADVVIGAGAVVTGGCPRWRPHQRHSGAHARSG